MEESKYDYEPRDISHWGMIDWRWESTPDGKKIKVIVMITKAWVIEVKIHKHEKQRKGEEIG